MGSELPEGFTVDAPVGGSPQPLGSAAGGELPQGFTLDAPVAEVLPAGGVPLADGMTEPVAPADMASDFNVSDTISKYHSGGLSPGAMSAAAELSRRGVLNLAGPITPESISTITGEDVGEEKPFERDVSYVGEAVTNIPESGFNYAKDIYQAVRHPIETAKGVGNVALGIVEKFVPGEQDAEKYADRLGQALTHRYGSDEAIKKTFAEDPVGMAGDIAGLLYASGLATKSKMLKQLGTAAEPLSAALSPAKKAIQAIPESVPEGLYESAAKMSTSIPAKERGAISRTAVEGGIMPTSKGVDKARGLIDGINDIITSKIDEATKAGTNIDTESLFKYIDDIKKETHLSDDPIGNKRAVGKIEKSIRQGLKESGSDMVITPAAAQELKKRVYKAVNYAGKPRATRYVDVAKKSIARAAKEEIETIYPELKLLNSKEGELIKLLDVIERSAARISNRDLIGIGVPVKAAAGAVGGAPGAAAGITSGILDAPRVKAKLAIALEKARKKPTYSPASSAARIGLSEAGQTKEDQTGDK